MRARAALTLAASLALLPPGAGGAPDQENAGRVIRGVTLSTHRAGMEWGRREVLEPTLEAIRGVGANWIAIHPYAWIRDDGSVEYRSFDDPAVREHVAAPVRAAHARGLQILVKPHLGYWGSRFAWRGEIAFHDEDDRRRFFEGYRRWIVEVARAAVGADAFVVGTELDRTLADESWWRETIAAVRGVNGAALTYAANWTDYERVPFWDALDAVGVQAYFPLSAEERPAEPTLRAAWRRRMAELRGFAVAAAPGGRPVLFTELGYNRSFDAAREPWSDRLDGLEAEDFQALCLTVALEEIERQFADSGWLVGAFLWKWFPSPRPVGRNFQLATPRLRRAIAAVWTGDGGGG